MAIVGIGVGPSFVRARVPLVLVSDAFTAADATVLTSYSALWVKHAAGSNTGDATIDANRLHNTNDAGQHVYYRSDFAPTSADYRVEADVVQKSDNDLSTMGVIGRADATAVTHYLARYNANGNAWQLFSVVAAAATQLGSNAVQVLTNDQAYRLALDMSGSSIVLLVDGAPKVTAVNTAIAAAGLAGVRTSQAATSSVGIHLDNFAVRQ